MLPADRWTIEERRRLYKAVRAVMSASGTTWPEVFMGAFGTHHRVGPGYEDNFRAGKIAVRRAVQIAEWLQRNHPQTAGTVEEDGNASTGSLSWEALLLNAEALLEVIVVDPAQPGIVAFADSRLPSRKTIQLGQSFCLRLECPINGYAVAFQHTASGWFSLPLNTDGKPMPVESGTLLLPFDSETKEPLPLSEEAERGRHRFVVVALRDHAVATRFLFGPGSGIPLPELDRLAERFLEIPEDARVLAAVAAGFTD
jgi:hypothetical protein